MSKEAKEDQFILKRGTGLVLSHSKLGAKMLNERREKASREQKGSEVNIIEDIIRKNTRAWKLGKNTTY